MQDVVRIGDEFCRPAGCDISSSSCRVNGYWKDESNYEECKTECISDLACIGIAVSDDTYNYPNRCYVYGTVSSKVGWNSYLQNYFDVHTSTGRNGVDCYRRQGRALYYH